VVAVAILIVRYAAGWSPATAEPVWQAIFERLPATFELAVVALMAAVVLGAAVGFALVRTRPRWLRGLIHSVQLLARAIPVVVMAFLIELVMVLTPLFPGFGIASRDAFDLGDRLSHVIAPALCLAVPFGAWMSVIFYEFFRATDATTRMPLCAIVWPVATSIALVGPAVLAACLLIEPAFAWPGIARLFYGALTQFDPGILVGCVLTYCAAIVLLDLAAEFAPRMPPASPTQLSPAGDRKRIGLTGRMAIVVLLCAVVGALAGDAIASGPYFVDQAHWSGYPLAPGVGGHLLGTDANGRDMLSRAMIALRTSLEIAAMAALLGLAIAFVYAKGTQALFRRDNMAALGVGGIRAFAGIPFVLTAVTLLVVKSRLHIDVLNPAVIAVIIAAVSWPAVVPAFRTRTSALFAAGIDLMAGALMLEVTQSAIGFGVHPPLPSLGNMLMGALMFFAVGPWMSIVPAVVIVTVLFALYALADDIREMARG
jgi:ABC-type dipeptide/oligopeptide/nickel transport system permease component/ABC-type dipeptide/oligopeptide/nickel transport system permease subunit